MDQPTADESLARLDRLVGEWDVESVWNENRGGGEMEQHGAVVHDFAVSFRRTG